jgi:cyclopropane-fatty-acyl-phospholipid synthase
LTLVKQIGKSREAVESLLTAAGVSINGAHPWDIQVRDDRFYRNLLANGSLGAGESYMDGWWECDRLDEMICRVLGIKIENQLSSWRFVLESLKAKLFNLQRKSKAFRIGEKHYDIGNDLYVNMLDRRMLYTCGYWKEASTLDQAQEHKLSLICRKIGLKAGMTLLDIGCGWGGLAKYAAENYGVRVVGITVSKEQSLLAKESCRGLPVEIRLQDYRDLKEKFDRIVSIGMFEHVGYKNYRRYMGIVHRCLADDGTFLLQTIGSNVSRVCTDPWIEKYIFPGSMLPSIKQIGEAVEGLFIMEDWHNFGPDYDKTLMAWFKNFDGNWAKIKSRYDERFYRMWRFYLLSCAGSFRARQNQVWQVLLSKKGVSQSPVRG